MSLVAEKNASIGQQQNVTSPMQGVSAAASKSNSAITTGGGNLMQFNENDMFGAEFDKLRVVVKPETESGASSLAAGAANNVFAVNPTLRQGNNTNNNLTGVLSNPMTTINNMNAMNNAYRTHTRSHSYQNINYNTLYKLFPSSPTQPNSFNPNLCVTQQQPPVYHSNLTTGYPVVPNHSSNRPTSSLYTHF